MSNPSDKAPIPLKNPVGGNMKSKRRSAERRAIMEHRRTQVAALCFDAALSAQEAADRLGVAKSVVISDRKAIIDAWREKHVHSADVMIVRALRTIDRAEARLWGYLNNVDARQAKRVLIDPDTGQPVTVEMDTESANRARVAIIDRILDTVRERLKQIGGDRTNALEIVLPKDASSVSVGVVVDLDGRGPHVMPGPDDREGFEPIRIVEAEVKAADDQEESNE